MPGNDLKDSRVQVATSLSCSVSAISDGRMLIDSTRLILSHQLFFTYTWLGLVPDQFWSCKNIGSSEDSIQPCHLSCNPTRILSRMSNAALHRLLPASFQELSIEIQDLSIDIAPTTEPKNAQGSGAPASCGYQRSCSTWVVYDDVPLENQTTTPAAAGSELQRWIPGMRPSEICRKSESAI